MEERSSFFPKIRFSLLQQNESFLDDILRKANNRERIFKLRIKLETYNVKLFNEFLSLSSILLV
jgi:hypothetical protein